MNGYTTMRYGYPLPPRSDLLVFNMMSSYEDKIYTCNYAMAVWTDDKPVPEYICLGPPYQSNDGEFRQNYTWYEDFSNGYDAVVAAEANLPKKHRVLDRLERKVLYLIEYSHLNLAMTVHAPTQARRDALTDAADSTRLMLKLFVAQMLLVEDAIRSPHIQPKYAVAMMGPRQFIEDIMRLTRPTGLEDDEERETYKRMLYFRIQLKCGSKYWGAHKALGMKIVPLMRTELINPRNVRYPVGREVWVTEEATNLMVNGRGWFFPSFNQVTTVVGADETMYDNEAMVKHYLTSEAADAALGQLRQAREVVAEKRSAGFAHKLDELDHYLWRGSQKSEEMIVSDVAMIITMRYVGPTLGTIAKLPLAQGAGFIQGEKFETILFQLCYAAHELHDIAIHCDLHYHNMTINAEWYPQRDTPENPCAVYVAGPGGERDTFVLPAYGNMANLIDFSQAIISPAQRESLVAYQGKEQTDTFFKEQALRMLRGVGRWLPEYAKEYEREIKGIALADPESMYNVLCAIDYIAIGRNVGQLLEDSAAAGKMGVDPAVVKQCHRLQAVARAAFIKELRAVVSRGSGQRTPTAKRETSGDALGLAILKDVFGHYLYSRRDPAELAKSYLVDAFNLNAPLRHNIRQLETFPPWARVEEIKKYVSISKRFSRDPSLLEASLVSDGDPALDEATELERGRSEPPPPEEAGHSWLTGRSWTGSAEEPR